MENNNELKNKKNLTPIVLSIISLILTLGYPLIMVLITLYTSFTSKLLNFLPFIGLELIVYVRLKYPHNIFARALLIIDILLFIMIFIIFGASILS